MTKKHTPGKWSVFDDGGELYGIIRYADGNAISTPEGCAMDGEVFICDLAIKDEANARLIATAPDMCDELIRAEEILRINGFADHANRIAALVARAKGEA
jgi:hypothetical protein